MIITCLIISHKFHNDRTFRISSFSFASKIESGFIAEIESAILDLLEYDLIVSTDEYETYSKAILHLVLHERGGIVENKKRN